MLGIKLKVLLMLGKHTNHLTPEGMTCGIPECSVVSINRSCYDHLAFTEVLLHIRRQRAPTHYVETSL